MKQNEEKKVADTIIDEPVVIPDECGDSMWDTVLEQSPFIQALKAAAKEGSTEKKS